MKPSLLACTALLCGALLLPAPTATAGPFEQGTWRLSLTAGYGRYLDNGYLIAGAGVGYFVINGLELNTRYEGWFLSEPRIHKLSPGAEYVLHFVPLIQPYVGAFYRYWILTNDFENFSTVGLRGGAYLSSAGPFLLSLGAVYERVVGSCEGDCSALYPELRLSLSF